MSQLDVIEFARKDRDDVDFGIISGKVIMRILEAHEIEAVTGGEAMPGSYPVYRYSALGEVWGGDDPFSSWIANQKYIAARDHAAANGITLTRADFFEY